MFHEVHNRFPVITITNARPNYDPIEIINVPGINVVNRLEVALIRMLKLSAYLLADFYRMSIDSGVKNQSFYHGLSQYRRKMFVLREV